MIMYSVINSVKEFIKFVIYIQIFVTKFQLPPAKRFRTVVKNILGGAILIGLIRGRNKIGFQEQSSFEK